MPTRSYYFPSDYSHFEALLGASGSPPKEEVLAEFRLLGVAPIVNVAAISLFLGISPKILHSIRKKPSRHYRKFFLRKSDGSAREINAPRTYLKVIQWWIADNIFRNSESRDYIFGFVPGRSIVSNANYHAGANHILNVDIRNFFPSVSFEQVSGVFARFGYSGEVVETLASLCCLDGALPQGAPTSPALANHVLVPMDSALAAMAQEQGCKYSRYADDLTFSSNAFIPEDLLNQASRIIHEHGFDVKNEKSRFLGRGQRMEVTGVVINDAPQLPRAWRKRVRSILHKMSYKGRLLRKDIRFLYGIKGVTSQFSDAQGMDNLRIDAERLLERFKSTTIFFGTPDFIPANLTRGEADVLIRLSARRTNADIGALLGVSEGTVKKRLTAAFRKIGVKGRVDAAAWANANL